MAHIEFKPPSDFVAADGGGGGKSSVWKWVGIGCGGLVLVVGIFMALGAWKTVSCCSKAVDSARQSAKASKFGLQAAQQFATGNVEAMRAAMSDEAATQWPADRLTSAHDNYAAFLGHSKGRVGGMHFQQRSLDAPLHLTMTVAFAQPAGTEQLAVIMDILSKGKGKTQHFVIDSLSFDKRPREIRSEPPAVEVRAFHDALDSGDYKAAYRTMSAAFAKQSDQAAFRHFVQEQQPVFRHGDVHVASIEYNGMRARLIARLSGEGGKHAQVEYLMVRRPGPIPLWRIEAITPSYDTAPAKGASPDAGTAGVGEAKSAGEKTAPKGAPSKRKESVKIPKNQK